MRVLTKTFSVGRGLLCGLAVFAVGTASAQIAKTGGGYTFHAKYTKGQSIGYVMKMSGSAQGQQFSVNMPMTQKVSSVTPAGVATVTMSVGSMSMTVGGKPMNTPVPANLQNVSMKVDSKGHVLEGGNGQQSTNVSLPDKAVPMGGTWTAATTTPTGMGTPMKVSATYKLVSIEKIGGFNAAKIKVTMSGKGQMEISGAGWLWLNVTDSSMVKYTTTLNMKMGTMVMPMSMSMSRK